MISLTVVILLFALIFGSLYLIYSMNKKEFQKRARRMGLQSHHPHAPTKKGSL